VNEVGQFGWGGRAILCAMSSQTEHEFLSRLGDARPAPGRTCTAFANLREARPGRTRDGKPYVDIVVSDQSASLSGKIWGSDHPRIVSQATEIEPGTAVKVLFEVRSYRGSVQLTVLGIRPVETNEDGYDATAVYGKGASLVADLGFRTLVFDIETVPAVEMRSLPPTVGKALATAVERGDNDEGKIMSLSPMFGKIVSLAVGEGEIDDVGDQEVTVLAVAPEGRERDSFPSFMRVMSEAELLACFWELASGAKVVVTYNGRGFDVPFLIMRSLIHGVPATVDLVSSPFSLRPHLDLYNVLVPRRGLGPSSLDVMCWALGMPSPKDVMDGSMVAPTYARGDIEAIATYNIGDIQATTRLYQHVRDKLLPFRNDW